MARKISAQYTSQPIPIASVHQYPYSPVYPYKMYPHHHPLSQSQFSLWDARSLISGVGNNAKCFTPAKGFYSPHGPFFNRLMPWWFGGGLVWCPLPYKS